MFIYTRPYSFHCQRSNGNPQALRVRLQITTITFNTIVCTVECMYSRLSWRVFDCPYRDGQKVRIHFLQASKKQFPEELAEDVEILSLLLWRKCMRTFWPSRYRSWTVHRVLSSETAIVHNQMTHSQSHGQFTSKIERKHFFKWTLKMWNTEWSRNNNEDNWKSIISAKNNRKEEYGWYRKPASCVISDVECWSQMQWGEKRASREPIR